MTTLTAPTAQTDLHSPAQVAGAKPRVSPRPRRQPVVVDNHTVVVPAGAYYLGDPCYVFDNEARGTREWDELLGSCDHFDEMPVGRVTVPSRPDIDVDGPTTDLFVVAFDTAYGDGGYSDRDGFDYSVDAGVIGLVPAWYAVANQRANGAEDASYLTTAARFVVFDTDVTCTVSGPDDGLLTFGPVEVVTHDEPEQCGRCGRDTDATGYCAWGCTEDEEDDCPDGCGQTESECLCDED